MRTVHPKIVAILTIVCVVTGTTRLTAGGFKIPDQSTRAMGMIDAFVAGADDASSVYYNPAGLTRLDGPQVIGNVYVAHAETDYWGPGGHDSSDGRIYVVPNLYMGTPIPGYDGWYAGLGVYSPFGLGSKWSDDSPVRYSTTISEIRLVNINPTIAWKATDRLALGAGVDYFTSRIILRAKNDYSAFPGDFADGETDFDGDGDGWGYNLGLQYELTDRISVGLTYRSQVNVRYDGDVQLDDVPVNLFPPITRDFTVGIESDVEYPRMIAGGISWQASDRLRLEFAAEWQNWETRDVQTIDTDGLPGLVPERIETPVHWENTWVLMLGAEYELNDRWRLRAGYGFNETPVPDETADPSLPVGDTHAVSLGAGWDVTDAVTLDIAGIVAYGEKRTLKSDYAPYDSDYEAFSGYLSLGITYNF